MSKYIGDVSAYAYAVSKGYTGTEEEFAELMASYADVGQTAVDAAESALNSKTAAQTAATTATNKASEATTAAQTATTKAGEAQTSAQTASSKASEASQSASTASQKATEASQSATNASQSAQTAEQAKTASQTAQGLAESARDSAISAKDDAESARDEAQNIVDGISAKAEQIDANTASVASLEEDRYKPYAVDTASGAVASFTDGADDLPLKSLVVNIDPVQDTSSGDPSPTNICPISGWTEALTNISGINVWDEEWEIGNWGIDTGEKGTLRDRIRCKNYILVVPSTAYYFGFPDSNKARILCYDKSKNYLGQLLNTSEKASGVYTMPDNCRFVTFNMTQAYGTNYRNDISINYPSTDHDYHHYTGRSIIIDLGQTVYGGRLDVLSGKLTVYPEYDSYNGEALTGRWISDRDVYAVGTTPTIGAQVVNIGAEGTEIQLEPHEIASLLGQNNIFADTGDSVVEYRADTKLYIERLTAPDSVDMIADANITSGQYFMVGNSLYKATANIANGGQIIVGTNATRVSLAQALNEINA